MGRPGDQVRAWEHDVAPPDLMDLAKHQPVQFRLLRFAPLEERGPVAMTSIERMAHLGSRLPMRPDVPRRAVAS